LARRFGQKYAMEILLQPEAWIALLTLTFLEIVLGIDNIIFISIVANKLPQHQQSKARTIGLALALGIRILLLTGITWVMQSTKPLVTIFEFDLSLRDIILLLGGLFLIAKSTSEIHAKINDASGHGPKVKLASFGIVLFQIVMLDIIFSIDSILTAIGMTNELPIMIVAVIISMIIMMVFSGKIAAFINAYPTLQILALSFLILIGFMLGIESFHYHVPKGYIYFAVFFSLMVELINLRFRRAPKTES
jgi:predicted tellurium resistance membrane protein TerC